MVEVGIAPPTAAQVDQAKADYQRSLEILMADRRATELRDRHAVLGKCFKHIASDDQTATWPVYIVARTVDAEGRLVGWHFQHSAAGQLEVATDDDLQPGFLHERCHEIERHEFVAAFNELLTAIARFASQMPLV